MEPRDYIDSDEGRDFPEPERQYCGGCDRALLPGEELLPCYWEPSIVVGACCLLHSDEEPLCPVGLEIVLRAQTVHQLAEGIRRHCAACTECGAQPALPKEVQREVPASSPALEKEVA